MQEDFSQFYECLAARDRRFDGIFFVGVTSTGIYCRPVCTAKTPSFRNCRFYKSQAEAEDNGFRPCLKCRPEIAPGLAPVDAKRRLARSALTLIQEAAFDEEHSIQNLAERLGITDRHLRRVINTVYGVSPNQLARTHRLLTAKRLLSESNLSLTEIAYASGFRSVRSFNHQFKKQYGLAPSSLRKQSGSSTVPRDMLSDTSSVQLRLTYRPPLEFKQLLNFFQERALKGLEKVDENQYFRGVSLGKRSGWYRVFQKHDSLYLEFSSGLLANLSTVVNRVNRQFDLECEPRLIQDRLEQDEFLAPAVQKHPGLRVPGAFDQFEVCVRAITGQLISVKAARAICTRLVENYGESIQTPLKEVTRSFPSPYMVSTLSAGDLAETCGLTLTKAKTIIELARSIARGELDLERGGDGANISDQLLKIKGIGPWTASYITMRCHLDPNSFPAADLGVRKALGLEDVEELLEFSNRWKPWRAYATMYLWKYSVELQGQLKS